MPKLFSTKKIEKVLLKQGFYFVSQKGSHIKYRKKNDHVYTVIVPGNRKEIPIGTFRSICRQARLVENDFK